MNRRQFAYVTGLTGAFAASGAGAPAHTPPARVPEAAGLLSEMVFLDDCVRLAMYDNAIDGEVKKALTAHPDFVRNGALWPGKAPKTGEETALAAGHSCSAALDRHRHPNSAEARLYQDVAVMRDMSAKAGCEPDKAAPVGDLLNVLHVRRRLGLHTLNPDDDIQRWLEGIVTWWNDQRELRDALASAYPSPDAAKMREFAAEFYNPADALIRLARGYQMAEVAPADAFRPALEQARGASHYARALAESVEALRKIPNPQIVEK
jgi:hypothetical protein